MLVSEITQIAAHDCIMSPQLKGIGCNLLHDCLKSALTSLRHSVTQNKILLLLYPDHGVPLLLVNSSGTFLKNYFR